MWHNKLSSNKRKALREKAAKGKGHHHRPTAESVADTAKTLEERLEALEKRVAAIEKGKSHHTPPHGH
jgi:hypothetical protein